MASTPDYATLIGVTEGTVKKYMESYDASHDHTHIARVVNLAHHIYQVESEARPEISYDRGKITLAALVHDVGDKKYLKPNETLEEAKVAAQKMLISNGADPLLAQEVQVIANAVSYTNECLHPESVQKLLIQHPELAIVQDADRLDGLGAVGIARCFTYNGANPMKGGTMESAIVHVNAKLVKLENMMKTGEGKRLAKIRWERVKLWQEWWDEEHNITTEGTRKTNWEGGSYKSTTRGQWDS